MILMTIINNPEIDTVFICSPTDTHAKIAIASAKAGKDIFCEKPIDLDVKRVEEVLAELKKQALLFRLDLTGDLILTLSRQKKPFLLVILGMFMS